MDNEIKRYIGGFPAVAEMFLGLRGLIFDCCAECEERMWARMPSYYCGERFVRLIPFKDHLNIEAAAIVKHADSLSGYKLTPKGMLQLYVGDALPSKILKQIFRETLMGA